MRKTAEIRRGAAKALKKTGTALLKIDAKKENLGLIRKFIHVSMRKSGFPGKKISALAVSLTEHCENLIRHAYAKKRGKVELQMKLNYPVAKITALDRGPMFNMNKISIPDTARRVKNGQGGKMGVKTILALCDRVEYKRKDGYNENSFIVLDKKPSKKALRKGK